MFESSQGQGAPQGQGNSQTGENGHSAKQGQGNQAGSRDEFLRSLTGQVQHSQREAKAARDEARKASERFERMERAFKGDDEGGKKEHSIYDEVLEEAIAAEREGRGGIPLTVKLSEKLRTTEERLVQAIETIEKLTKQGQMLSDPAVVQENDAFSKIDVYTQKAIEQIYGDHHPAVFDAVTKSMVADIREMKKDDPELWRKVVVNPSMQRKLVNHHLSQVVPPNARKMMLEHAESQQPFTRRDSLSALQEVRNIENPRQRAEAQKLARYSLWENMVSQGNQRR